ncbi:MAG: LamG domain-containing protein, partial [Bacteroidota bacterium]
MKTICSSVMLILTTIQIFAQDTTWVQTFTFDSITTRRSDFVFPEELNSKRFEKVLMYYKLKCSPLTTWDQYDCGEWDYLTYTRVFDHTGVYDSVRVDGQRYVSNMSFPSEVNFTPVPYSVVDTYVRDEHNRSGAALPTQQINNGTTTAPYPFDISRSGGRFQMLLTAGELQAAGVVAGNIESLSLYLSSIETNGELRYPSISIKGTSDVVITSFHTNGFTEVYDASHWALGSQTELVVGQNELLFYQPFAWNGTDNLIIEFSFENTPGAVNALLFDAENVGVGAALSYDALNGHMKFDGTNYSMTELSDFTVGPEMTIAFWAKGTGSAGTNTSVLEAYDIAGNRIINIHMPWSDNTMYFDAGEGNGYDRISKPMTGAEIDNNWNHWAFVKKQSTGEMFIYKNGVLWHSGTGKNMEVGYVHRLIIGSNMNQAFMWKGKLDEFQFFDAALTPAAIQGLMYQHPDASHPNWSDLKVYYDFDHQLWAEDRSQNDYLLMPSEMGMFAFDEYPNAGVTPSLTRPVIGVGQGTVSGAVQTTAHPQLQLKEPVV